MRAHQFLIVLLAMSTSAAAFAGLKAVAPKNVDLTGLWQINPEQSDDPKQLMEKKREEAMSGRRGGRGGMGGGMGGGIGMPGGGGGGGTWGGGAGGGEDGPPSGMGRGRGPRGQQSSEESDRGEGMPASIEQMLATQEQLDIRQEPSAMTFASIDQTNTCKAGETAQVSMPDGNMADRTCGWKRKKFIIELKSPKGLTRTEQYALDKNQLIVITELKGGRGPLSGMKIKRTYDRVVPAT